MIIDVRALRLKGKLQENFSFERQLPSSLCEDLNAEFTTPCTVNCTVDVYQDEVFIAGELKYSISAPCARCLEKSFYDGVIEFDERFVPSFRKDEEDDEALVYEKDRIDLTKFIDELILTDMPLSLLCRDDCKGICFHCGQNLNEGTCEHIENN